MTFSVDVVLKGHDFAVTETVTIDHDDPTAWTDLVAREVLVEILRAIGRVENPKTADRGVVLRGFSWIVEPANDDVVIAIEIPMGAAVAGPFKIKQAELDAMITRVLKAERQLTTQETVH